MLSPFRMVCRNFILPEFCKPCLFFPPFILRNLSYLIPFLCRISIYIPNGSDRMTIRRDPNGQPMTIGFNGSEHFYLYNAQGDVVAIANYSGEVVVEYTYAAWGNPLSCTGSLADTLGKKNPFRYRGYVYDEETGFYYLKSRYYDPRVGRFICSDGILPSNRMTSSNLFAYCNNNPIKNIDLDGRDWYLYEATGQLYYNKGMNQKQITFNDNIYTRVGANNMLGDMKDITEKSYDYEESVSLAQAHGYAINPIQ